MLAQTTIERIAAPYAVSAVPPTGYDLPMKINGLDIPDDKLADFCQRWKIMELALFGSVLRDDFGPDSDVDVLVELAPDHGLGLYDLIDMEQELRGIFGRDVDLVTKGGLRNPFRRHEILSTRQVVYAA